MPKVSELAGDAKGGKCKMLFRDTVPKIPGVPAEVLAMIVHYSQRLLPLRRLSTSRFLRHPQAEQWRVRTS